MAKEHDFHFHGQEEHFPHQGGSSQTQSNPEDVNTRLISCLREIGHTIRFFKEGKGSQNRILIILDQTGPITQRALTEQLGIRPGSASEVIAKLENAGLIARTPSQEDRRTADISLTPAGKEKAQEARQARSEKYGKMFDFLSQEEKEGLLASLEHIRSVWRERYDGEQQGRAPGREDRHGHHGGCEHHQHHGHHGQGGR